MSDMGHNGGPPLEEPHEWGAGPVGKYFDWKHAHREAFEVPYEIALMRARRAAALGLTYEEYTLELMERGRFLQASDTERIMQIKLKRPVEW
ncbi:hypothetical protein [Devosia sp. RR2S18]|jgi:hypothetical protein|uniref:hypothetical protein n=1 Tax=Devosia rhizosphaerae TaxID=3049774 RepID=UPI0025418577|nr:hypothetical protein [Devosia sp. RR2S18]WIJ26147.1 hypothetical protein QOV41_05125 [Devosia sp. RR2S18]HEV7291511.1 hypothetical protein [Devosia sp.]